MRRELQALLLCSLLQVSTAAGQDKTDSKHLIYMTVWRGCEAACKGFKDFISKSGMKAEVVVRNAGRDKKKLPGFVEEARSMRADLLITWGTSVTLGMIGTLENQDDPRFINRIPAIFMIVADPVRAKIIEDYEYTGRKNVTGTRNRVPEPVNIKAVRTYYPAFKHLGLLYNTNEKNSILKMEEIKDLSSKMNFKFTSLELKLDSNGRPNRESFSFRMAEMKKQGVDFVYLGSSSFLRKNGDAFTAAAVENGLPVLSPYEHLVRKSHALMSVAARYYDVGQLAGEQAKAILVDGKSPADLPVRSVANYAYLINMGTARKLKMFPSVAILQFAETVNK